MNKAQIEFLRNRINNIVRGHSAYVEQKYPFKDGLSSTEMARLVLSGKARLKKFETEDDAVRHCRPVDLFQYPGDAERERFNQRQQSRREKAMQPIHRRAAMLLEHSVLVDAAECARGLRDLEEMRPD